MALWPIALSVNEVLITTTPVHTTEFAMAVRNRALIFATQGDFSNAVVWYERGRQQSLQHMQNIMALIEELGSAYAKLSHGGIPKDLSHLRKSITANQYTWYIYWWYVTHAAWQQHDWTGLERAYRESQDAAPTAWATLSYLGLAGVHAAIQVHQGHPHSLQLLEDTLALPNLQDFVDLNIENDLIQDWIQLLIKTNDPRAFREWGHHVVTMHLKNLPGWVSSMLRQRPHGESWDSLPQHEAQTLRRILSDPPQVPEDLLIQKTAQLFG